MIQNYQRRAAEIQLALYVDYVYQQHKSLKDIIEFFRQFSISMNTPNFEFVEQCILRYNDLMPTLSELVLMSDLAPSRQGFSKADIIQNKIGRTKFYSAYASLKPDIKLEPKLNIRASDAVINFIKNFQKYAIAFAGIKILGYEYD